MTVRADVLPEPAVSVPSPSPDLVTVGRYDQRPGYRVHRPHGSDSWLFTWTTAGRGSLRQGVARTTAGAGDLVVLGPGVPHRYGVEPGSRPLGVLVDPLPGQAVLGPVAAAVRPR